MTCRDARTQAEASGERQDNRKGGVYRSIQYNAYNRDSRQPYRRCSGWRCGQPRGAAPGPWRGVAGIGGRAADAGRNHRRSHGRIQDTTLQDQRKKRRASSDD